MFDLNKELEKLNKIRVISKAGASRHLDGIISKPLGKKKYQKKIKTNNSISDNQETENIIELAAPVYEQEPTIKEDNEITSGILGDISKKITNLDEKIDSFKNREIDMIDEWFQKDTRQRYGDNSKPVRSAEDIVRAKQSNLHISRTLNNIVEPNSTTNKQSNDNKPISLKTNKMWYGILGISLAGLLLIKR
jgi:hypothetical protein